MGPYNGLAMVVCVWYCHNTQKGVGEKTQPLMVKAELEKKSETYLKLIEIKFISNINQF